MRAVSPLRGLHCCFSVFHIHFVFLVWISPWGAKEALLKLHDFTPLLFNFDKIHIA